jgi:hypothetical protein
MSLLKKLAPLTFLGALTFASPAIAQSQSWVSPQPSPQQPSPPPAPAPSSQVTEGPSTWNFYLTGGIGAISPYGLSGTFGLKAGAGWEKDTDGPSNGLGVELDLMKLMQFEVAAKFSKTFGRRGLDTRFYMGLELLYQGTDKELGLGAGVYSGVEFPLTRNLTLGLDLEASETELGTASSSEISANLGVKYFF